MPVGDVHRSSQSRQSRSEQAASIIAQDQLKALIEEDHDGETNEPGEDDKVGKKRKRSDKPASVALLQHEADVKDMVQDYAGKLADSSLLKHQGQSKLDEALDAVFKEEFRDKSQDTVVLSKAGMAGLGKKSAEVSTPSDLMDDGIVTSDGDDTLSVEEQQKKVAKHQKTEQAQRQQAVRAQFKHTPQSQETLKQYMAAVSETMVRESPQKKQEVDVLRGKLRDQGYSPKLLKRVEQNMARFLRTDLRKQIKNRFMEFALSYDGNTVSIDVLKESERFSKWLEQGEKTGALGKGVTEADIKNDAKAELRGFIADELDQTLVRKKLGGASGKELIAAFNKFNDIAGVAHFDPGEYLKHFSKKMDDMGLNPFEDPNFKGVVDTDARGDGGKDDQQAPSEDEIMALEDDLRTLYMQRITKRDIKSLVTLPLQIVALKKKMRDKGIYSEETMTRLQEEGEAMAKLKLMALLRESFEERAVLLRLEGPEFKLTRRKMKAALKGLRLLDASPSKATLRQIRDEVQRLAFSVIREEYVKVEVMLDADKGNRALQRRRDDFQGILERLKKESKLVEDIKPNLFQGSVPGDETAIVESA